jgi:catechol 2,3-dioxygenase-like lactoylglutathione lyase family enzyme
LIVVQFTGIGHLHLKVADVERAARFYEEGLGMRRMSVKHDGKLIALFLPPSVDVLTLSEGAIGAEVDRDSADIGAQGGIDHFGFALSEDSSLEEAIARLVSAGARYSHHHDIAPGVPTAFLRDPDGYVFQIWKLPKGAAELAAAYASTQPSSR